ncbi:hypothetical protein [Kordiimonas aestuarii]|uniref:hypothetical protein n=1 Tax=Kordiimonas aestuarii TaxID=1005925 RepID=UPI0021D2D0B7|nr:hypothetical protein [Kordiimonas aestuarii]
MEKQHLTSFDAEKAKEGKKILIWLTKATFIIAGVVALDYWLERTLSFRGAVGVLFMMVVTRLFISRFDKD